MINFSETLIYIYLDFYINESDSAIHDDDGDEPRLIDD